MNEVPGELDLMAYADGELDAAGQERVRQYLATRPEGERKVEAFKKLQQAGRRVMSDVAVPAGLLDRIAELDEPAPRPIWRIGYLRAAAAILIVALGTVAFLVVRNAPTPVVQGSPLVTAQFVSSASKVHINCARDAEHFAAGFPRKVQELPGSLQTYLGHSATCPDLTDLGYRFNGCGPCAIPGGKTAHLLYQSTQGKGPVSLFIQADEGQLLLEDHKVYLARDAVDGTEMIVWRGHGVVYYLVGENDEQLANAAQEMGVKVRI
jgi:anti-sigma factor RsiW